MRGEKPEFIGVAQNLFAVVPAQAGIHAVEPWMPAFAGMTSKTESSLIGTRLPGLRPV